MQGLISIIVPVYKVKKEYLSACVNSIINQTYRNIELIIVDDGSPDKCGIYCDQYASQDKRIKVIHQINSGVSGARNAGINTSTGKWIMFVDSDDWLELNACEELISELENNTVDILQFSGIRCYKNSTTKMKYGLEHGRLYSGDVFLDKELLYRKAMQPLNFAKRPVSTCTSYYVWDKIYNRQFLVKNKLYFPEGIPVSEDKVFFLRCLQHISKFKYVDWPLYHYRLNEGSASNRYSYTLDKDRTDVIKILQELSVSIGNELASMQGAEFYEAVYRDFQMFVLISCSGVIVKKFYHSHYPDKVSRRKDTILFIQSEPYNSAIQSASLKEFSFKNALRVFLIKHHMFRVFTLLFNMSGNRFSN